MKGTRFPDHSAVFLELINVSTGKVLFVSLILGVAVFGRQNFIEKKD